MELFLASLCGIICSTGILPVCSIFIRRENESFKLSRRTFFLSGIIGASAFFFSDMAYSFTARGLLCYAIFLILMLASIVDYYCQIVPDICQILILALAAISAFLLTEPGIISRLIGFVIISAPLLLVCLFSNGFGGGDIKLFAVCGLLLGAKNIVLAFLISVILAAIFGLVFVKIKAKRLKTRIAFVPFISIGVMVAAIFGDLIIRWYWGLF